MTLYVKVSNGSGISSFGDRAHLCANTTTTKKPLRPRTATGRQQSSKTGLKCNVNLVQAPLVREYTVAVVKIRSETYVVYSTCLNICTRSAGGEKPKLV